MFLPACLLAISSAIPADRPAQALAPLNPAALKLQEVATGLSEPVLITNAGDGSGRLFIVEHTGTIRILKNGALLATPFLDIHTDIRYGGEQGLLALAFHPSYTSNGYFYVAYTAPRTGDATGSVLTLKRFTVSGNPDVANAGSGSVILTIDHPTNTNHNGGTLAFGPDHYLYWSTGDGGSAGDPPNNAQNLSVLLGKILRLDVDHTDPGLNYAVPSNNPFVESPDDPSTRDEIWAYGLRNPWRMSFDRTTGDLYIGDVGQDNWEEVDFQPASSAGGENYGWHMYEGNACYIGPCSPTGKVFPVTAYDHTGGRCALTGGYVYRGSLYPALRGYYLYGDECSGAMYALHNEPGSGWVVTTLPDTSYSIASFGEDEQGELYLADLSGTIYHIRYWSGNAPTDFDGDHKTDPAKYVPAAGAAWYLQSGTGTWGSKYIGSDGAYVLNSDFDGDGKTDPAKYVASAGAVWYLKSSTATWQGVYIGSDGQYVPGSDFDGDGKTDPAKYVASAGALWYLKSSTSTWVGVYIGSDGTYVPGSDFDGDGKTDPAKFVAGAVYYLQSSTGTWGSQYIGSDGTYVPRSDFDGDGKTDPAKFVAGTLWYLPSTGGGLLGKTLGTDGSAVAGCDFDGDGITDPAKFVLSAGAIWYLNSGTGLWGSTYMGSEAYEVVN